MSGQLRGGDLVGETVSIAGDHLTGQSAHRARDREPHLAAPLWTGDCPHSERLRPAGESAQPPRGDILVVQRRRFLHAVRERRVRRSELGKLANANTLLSGQHDFLDQGGCVGADRMSTENHPFRRGDELDVVEPDALRGQHKISHLRDTLVVGLQRVDGRVHETDQPVGPRHDSSGEHLLDHRADEDRQDEPRRHVQTGGIDDARRCRARQVAKGNDAVAADTDVRVVPGVARAVDDTAAANQNVVLRGQGSCHGQHGEHQQGGAATSHSGTPHVRRNDCPPAFCNCIQPCYSTDPRPAAKCRGAEPLPRSDEMHTKPPQLPDIDPIDAEDVTSQPGRVQRWVTAAAVVTVLLLLWVFAAGELPDEGQHHSTHRPR